MWILTASVCPSPQILQTYPNYMYFLAMGPSNKDHTKVINRYIKQIKTIRKGKMKYCGNNTKVQY